MSSLIHKQRKFLSTQAEAQIERWAVRFMAILTAAMGVINLLSAVTPALADRLILLSKILPMEVRYGSRLASALAGFALLVLAFGLWRRKRAAWMLTVYGIALATLSLCVEDAAASSAGARAGHSGGASTGCGYCAKLWTDRPSAGSIV